MGVNIAFWRVVRDKGRLGVWGDWCVEGIGVVN